MALLTTIAAALSGKTAATLAGVTLVGGGLAVAADNAQPSDEAAPVIENLGTETVDLMSEAPDTDEKGPDNDEGRSADVHDALTDGEAEPGDEDFGQTVSENAREGGRDFGQNVAETARDGAGEEQSADGRERANEARDGAGEEQSADGRERANKARDGAGEDAETQASEQDRAEAGPETGQQNADDGKARAPETPAGDASEDRPGGRP